MIKTAVVILNWNGIKFLQQFLPGVIENTVNENYKVFIADNGSVDDSIHFAESLLEKKYIIRFTENYGFAQGYNKALELIDAEYYVLLNSDVEVTLGWIGPVIKYMDENKDVAACMPKIKSYHQREMFEYAGAAGGYLDKFGYPFCRGRILNEIEKDTGQYNDTKQVFWATGACMFIRAEAYKQTGGLDNDFFAHMEEIDLCWRLNNAGYKIMVVPETEVFHVGGGTLPNNNPRKLYLNFRNSLFMLYKNLPVKNFRKKLFFRMFLDGIAAMLYLITFKFSYFKAVLRAHFSFWKALKSLKNKRKHNLSLRKNAPSVQLMNLSILVAFMFKGIRKYSQIFK